MSRYPLAILSGLAIWLAFPSHDLWFLAPVGVAMLALATRGAGLRQGALLGLLCGLACFVPLLSWSGIYVGAVPWIALSVLESLYVALLGLASAALQGGSSSALARRARTPPRASGRLQVRPAVVAGLWASDRLRVRPAVVAALWVAQEALRGSTPFGGFPWGRLAFSQADSPLARLAALGGAPAVTFGVALVGGVLAVAVLRLPVRGRKSTYLSPLSVDNRPLTPARTPAALTPAALTPAVAAAAGALVLSVLPLAIPVPRSGETARFMAVQGNVPRAGLSFNAQRRAVLDNHAAVTHAAADSVRAGTQPPPDLVVWPENASDIDPLRNPDAEAVITAATNAIGAPVLVGAVLDGPAPHLSNASLLYRPGMVGVTQRYVKQHPVPFAEYIPYRWFFRFFSDKVDLIARDFVAGHGVGIFRVPSRGAAAESGSEGGPAEGGSQGAPAEGGPRGASPGGGPTISAGAVICFEVAYDDLVRDTVNHGANVLLVQTNNATFGYTDESVQQLAISRIRAIEHGRSVVHVSTVGVSALITPDGTAHQRSALFTSALLAGDLPLRADRTVADRMGGWPQYVACGWVVLLLARLGLQGLRARRRPTAAG